jgi:hypothetical protein
MRKTNPIPGGAGRVEAPGRGTIMQNEPNLGHWRKKSGGDAQPAKSRSVQNEPNFGRPVDVPQRIVQNEPNFSPPQVADGENCAIGLST